MEGFIKHGIVLSYYFLLRHDRVKFEEKKEFYYKAMRYTTQLGGDTDTNACIVGGMIGALVGFRNIPVYMIDKLLAFDCNT